MLWEILVPLNTQKDKFLKGQEELVYTVSIKNNDTHFRQFHVIIRIQDVT